MMVGRIALLYRDETLRQRDHLQRFAVAAKRLGIETAAFARSEEIETYQPDFVLALSREDAKLTRFPTYGVLNEAPEVLLEVQRYLRNFLTYDAYATASKAVRRAMKDVTFGARKLDSPAAFFCVSAPMTPFRRPNVENAKALCRIGPGDAERFSALLGLLKRRNLIQFFGENKDRGRFHLDVRLNDEMCDGTHFQQLYNAAGVGLCLEVGHPDDGVIPTGVLEIISSGALAIATGTDCLKEAFGNTLLYIDPDFPPSRAADKVAEHLQWISQNPDEAVRKAALAHEVFCDRFALEALIPNLIEMHEVVLTAKGYRPNVDERTEKELPSVSYIMRTGNRPRDYLERALDSLAAQNYPGLVVIFVLYEPMPHAQEVIAKYPELKCKVVEDFGKLRSSGICTGMMAVETELFGMLDDDDELHPNHVRSLVKALRYHDNLDWRGKIGFVYSASVEVGATIPRTEKAEWRDEKYVDRRELRCVEHYRFYSTREISRHQWYLMSNSWLARKSLIDDEILDDPEIDTCEDLCLVIQFAQKTHFAFSTEMTAVHHYHDRGNSTFVDAHRHIPDTAHIALRNVGREFPQDSTYTSVYTPVGRRLHGGAPVRYAFESEISKPTEAPEAVSAGPGFTDYSAIAAAPTQSRPTRSAWGNAARAQTRPAAVNKLGLKILPRVTLALAYYLRSPESKRQQLKRQFFAFRRSHGFVTAFRRTADYGLAKLERPTFRPEAVGSLRAATPVARSKSRSKLLPRIALAYVYYQNLSQAERNRLRSRFLEMKRSLGLVAAIKQIAEYANSKKEP